MDSGCPCFFPGGTEEEVFDDMKGHGVTFQSITHLFLPLVMHTCMNVTRIAHTGDSLGAVAL